MYLCVYVCMYICTYRWLTCFESHSVCEAAMSSVDRPSGDRNNARATYRGRSRLNLLFGYRMGGVSATVWVECMLQPRPI